jgi:hypothetical protein
MRLLAGTIPIGVTAWLWHCMAGLPVGDAWVGVYLIGIVVSGVAALLLIMLDWDVVVAVWELIIRELTKYKDGKRYEKENRKEQ